MRLVVSWMREFAAVPAGVSAEAIASRLAACGFEVAEILGGPDPVIDFEITANRPDCLSVRGLAREASVAFGAEFKTSERSNGPNPPASGSASNVSVSITAPDLCLRYAAQVARVRVGPSPEWLADRLTAAGVRPINNVVDVTNYVMIECGHPMHAFDLDRLAGGQIVVRRAVAGEKLRTLDGIDRALDPEMLVIADATRALAVAGVMGGSDSEVSALTKLVAFESAWFLPRSVRATSKRLGLKTEASARFERGADIEAPARAMARALELLQQIGAGEAAGPIADVRPAEPPPIVVVLRDARITRLLGAPVPATDTERILSGLGFDVRRHGEGWRVGVPSWRVDVQREADLIEEVGRHFGYDRLPTTFPALEAHTPPPDLRIARDQLARRVMLASGFDEAVTFTFVERRAAEPFSSPSDLVAIANPLSEKFAVLRPSLLPGLLDALARNRRHGRPDVRLFETGSCFGMADGEHRRVAFAWIGRAADEHWSAPARHADFFDARGVVEQLCAAFGIDAAFTAAALPWLLRGRSARIRSPQGELGSVGQLAPAIVDARDVPGGDEVYVAELDLDALGSGTIASRQASAVARFPSVVRDLSILVDDGLPAGEVRGTIRTAAPTTLVEVREFDRYQGKGIPGGRVSLSYHLTFRAQDRTLTDAEVDAAMRAIVSALEQTHGATRR